MKALIVALALLGSSSAFAASKTADLKPSEITVMRSVFSRTNTNGSPTHAGACFTTEAQISASSYSMGSADWTISQNNETRILFDAEIPTAIAMFDRLGAKGPVDNGTTKQTTTVTISETYCGIAPVSWTATFDDGK